MNGLDSRQLFGFQIFCYKSELPVVGWRKLESNEECSWSFPSDNLKCTIRIGTGDICWLAFWIQSKGMHCWNVAAICVLKHAQSAYMLHVHLCISGFACSHQQWRN